MSCGYFWDLSISSVSECPEDHYCD
jgi:hypothetical protein